VPTKTTRKSVPIAARPKWEAALSKIEALPPKTAEDGPAHYLPRFVAGLREKGYMQDEIVQKLLGLRLGLTDREIRTADKAHRQGVVVPAAPLVTARPTPAAPTRATAVAATHPATHAGLAGDQELQRR